MTSATDRLRELLDERGVEWRDDSSIYGTRRTVWAADGVTYVAAEVSGRLKVSGYLTPEQAIEATLGRGKCHDCLGDIEPFECSECHRRNDTNKFPNYCWYCGVKVVEK